MTVRVCVVFSAVKDREVLSRDIPVAGIATVTVHVVFRFVPSVVVAVIVAVPLPLAVTIPVLLTVATLVLLLVHLTVLFAASLGTTVAVRVCVLFILEKVSEVLSRETPSRRVPMPSWGWAIWAAVRPAKA